MAQASCIELTIPHSPLGPNKVTPSLRHVPKSKNLRGHAVMWHCHSDLPKSGGRGHVPPLPPPPLWTMPVLVRGSTSFIKANKD